MARRRMIDPNFWQSEDVSKLTIRQRLLLIGLFSNADDEGKLRGNPAFVRSAIFPYEDFTLGEIEDDLNNIELIGSIQQYEVETSKYIRLINWKKFQRVDKPQPSVIPDPFKNGSSNDSKNDSKNDSCLKERKGKELNGEEYKAVEERDEMHIATAGDEFKTVLDSFCSIHGKAEHQVFSQITDIQKMIDKGIPSSTIISVMKEKHAEKEKRGESVNSFSYYHNAIIEVWEGEKKVEEYRGSTKGFQPRSDQTTSAAESITGGQLGWIGKKRNNVVQMQNVQG